MDEMEKTDNIDIRLEVLYADNGSLSQSNWFRKLFGILY